MKIRRKMSHKPITIGPDKTVIDALDIMKKSSIRHLPVLDGKKFVGFVSEFDLREVRLLPLSGTLPGPASLPPPLSGYLFANSPEVSAGKELSIEPGTVLKFSAGVAMAVKGTLTASETAGSPIVFTSHRDDEPGGDGNDDGPSAGAPGDWVGIQVAAASCTLRHTLVRFAGCPDTGNNRNGILAYGAGTSLAVEDSTVELTAGIGVAIGSKASAAISRTAVRENDSHGIYVGGGASVVLDGCAIQENVFDGIHIENAACDLRSNEIGGNRYALSFEEGLQVSHDGGNRIEGNESDAAVAFVGDRFLSGTLPGPASLPPPLGCNLFTVSPGVTTAPPAGPEAG